MKKFSLSHLFSPIRSRSGTSKHEKSEENIKIKFWKTCVNLEKDLVLKQKLYDYGLILLPNIMFWPFDSAKNAIQFDAPSGSDTF